MSNRLSFFISVFVVALVVSVSFVQLFTENTSRRASSSLGAQAADFASGISVHAITPSDDAFIEGATGQNSSVLKVQPGSKSVYLKFNVSGVSGPVSEARLYLTQMSDAGEGTITASLGAHSNWTESTLSSDSAPSVVSEVGSLAGVFENSKTYAIDIAGITGNGTYTLILGMEDGGNDVWFSSSEDSTSARRPRLEVVTGGVLLPFEAENALPRGSFITESISTASNGAYLIQPTTVANTTTAREEAQLSVSITESGEYSLWVRMYAPSTSSDAFYAGFNGALTRIFPSVHGGWTWKEVSRANLSSGTNRISIGPGESGLRIDLFAVVRDSSVTAGDLDAHFNTQSGGGDTTPDPTPEPTNPIPGDGSMSLRGDPTFSQGNLPSELSALYDAFWVSLNNSYPNLESASRSSNQYNYGRTLYQGMFMISTAFRQTGDLNLLDRMYELNKNMYDQLSDSWTSGTISPYYDSHVRKDLFSTDGYRNWRYEYSCTIGGTDRYCGRDNHRLEESLSHGMVAATMYALHLNRDLESPKGYNYGDMADRWLNYLRGDFEAKWRERYGKAWPEMPFFSRYFTHTNIANLKTNYYVGLVLRDKGDSRASVYLAQADRMVNEIFDEPHVPSGSGEQAGGFVETSTPLGPAYIWAFGTPYGYGINSVSAAPATYARYFLGMAAELHFDGVTRFDDEAMRKLSRTVAHFILDTDPPFSSSTLMLAADVVGGDGDGAKYVSGMQSTSYRGRNNANRYAISTFGVYGLWDSSGRIDRITDAVYGAVSNRDRLVQLNGSRFITAFDKAVSSN